MIIRRNSILGSETMLALAAFRGRSPPPLRIQHPLLPPAIGHYNWVEIGHFGAPALNLLARGLWI